MRNVLAFDHADPTQAEEIARRVRVLLPELYQGREDEVRPVSMGSAGLLFGDDGQVAWDRIWGSFCDLAMAGGPPHRGTLLAAPAQGEVAREPGRQRAVLAEICRGITLVTGLEAAPARAAGWVRVECPDTAAAGWLARAITMENVEARPRGAAIEVPAGPGFRVEKEIKNVITACAKTAHYWFEHTTPEGRAAIAALLVQMEAERPLAEPGAWAERECGSVEAAIGTMRALATANVLARREGTTVFYPAQVSLPGSGSEQDAHRK